MTCQWCGSGRRVREVRRNGVTVAGPWGTPLHLCYACWGLYRESGQRVDQRGRPSAGPVSGIPLTGRILRSLRGAP